jgi:DNA (cytosine-5)-methyltransferase 1
LLFVAAEEAMPTFYEFFAGGGMARAGLGDAWQCLFANDIDPKKAASYTANWGDREFKLGDIYDLKTSDLPGHADLAWASFPCQDLSLAGNGAGLDGERSGAFWGFWELIESLHRAGRAPRTVVIENVGGTITSQGGKDFEAICEALKGAGYVYGGVLIDAVRFVPQSRPRLFMIAARRDKRRLDRLTSDRAEAWCVSDGLYRAYGQLPKTLQADWRWWRIPEPPRRRTKLVDFIDPSAEHGNWHSSTQTEYLLSLMTPLHRSKIKSAKRGTVGTIYRRMRKSADGSMVQRAEVRLDNVAGCLRTPSGGSSRQIVVVIEGKHVRTRLLSLKEAGSLMGLPGGYQLPARYNEAYHLIGDGVAVPIVKYLSDELILQLLGIRTEAKAVA